MIDITQDKPVLFGIESYGGLSLANLELNRPTVLNALNTQSYELIEPRLLEWQHDASVAAVCISARGDRAFCAGGDVKSLVQNVKRDGISAALDFFTREYFVDCLLQTYSKPVVAICHGVTMGGGIGISNGAHLRIATEKTLMAMPELSIGLFPDVGATRFLHNIKKPYGVFLGLTGARISGLEAVRLGLMNVFIPSGFLRKFRSDLLRLPFTTAVGDNRKLLNRFISNADDISNFAEAYPDQIIVASDRAIIEECFTGGQLAEIDRKFNAARGLSPWLEETRTRYNTGSALARAVFFHAFQSHGQLSMPETFFREFSMAIRFSKDPEFAEGVRAVLIDKDQKPQWRFASLQALFAAHFDPSEYLISGEARNLLADKWQSYLATTV